MMRFSTRLSLSLTLLSWIAGVRSQNCQLQVPANPLTAQGLATPYVLTGCNQFNFVNEGAFVEAAILDPATGNIQIYNPLVINAGMTPVGNGTGSTTTSAGAITSAGAATATGTTTSIPSSSGSTSTGTSADAAATMAVRQATSAGFYIPPVVPTLPNNAVVGIWFGSNANSLTLTGSTGGCTNGLGNSVFGQFAYCNGQAWFKAATTAVSQGLIKLTPPGTGSGGQVCPTTHDFRIVDQDQSDNVVTTYLAINNNILAQNSPENSKANPNAEVLSNASDNALVVDFIDPALGCAPYQNPCTTCPTGQSSALSTDELVAFFFPPAGGPALVPLNDPMVLVNGQQSLQKVNLYRDGTGQPQADNNNASGLTYCQQFPQSGIFINDNQQLFSKSGSPAPNMATNLFTFLAMRFSASFGPAPGLGCAGLLNVANPVTLTMDGNGVVTAATINTQILQQILGGGTGNTTATSVSAGTTTPSATMTTTASPTGVLLHLTSGSSSVSSTALTNATATGTTITSAPSVAQASTIGSTTTASSTPTCTNVPTVTVTVTATVCPTQASSATPTSTTTSNGGWNNDDGNNGNYGNCGGQNRKRSSPFEAHRLHGKSRIASFDR